MTVEQLIEKLKKMPQHYRVVLAGTYDVARIKSIDINDDIKMVMLID